MRSIKSLTLSVVSFGEASPTKITTKKMKSTSYIDEQILCDILSRLPLKSLVRFKCVCKFWKSFIEKDQWLINLHHSRQLETNLRLSFLITKDLSESPRLLFMNLLMRFPRDESVKFESHCTGNVYIDTNHAEITTAAATTQAISNKDLLVCEQVKKPINGMICLIDKKEHGCYPEEDHAACMYNIITGEATPWIRSTHLAQIEQWYDLSELAVSRAYEFGYDPTTNEYKVICMWRIFGWELPKYEGYGEYTLDEEDEEGYEGCYKMSEILTLGKDTAWRRIDKLPPYNYCKDIYGSVYANGYVYWINFKDSCHTLVAFDVGSEEYRIIPDLDLLGLGHPGSFHLIEMDGHPVIGNNAGNHTINLWVLNDDCGQNISNIKWTKEIIMLPLSWSYENVRVHTIEGTEYLILQLIGCQSCQNAIFAYNWKKKIFSKMEITGVESPHFLGGNNGHAGDESPLSLGANINDHPGDESPSHTIDAGDESPRHSVDADIFYHGDESPYCEIELGF